MASVRRHGKGWQVRWKQPDGSAAHWGGVRTRAEAEAVRREIEDTVNRGIRWEPRDARPVADLHEIAAAYVRDCNRRLKPRTVLLYAERVQTFLRWLAGTDPRRRRWTPDVLSRPLIEDFYDHLASTPKTAGRSTAGPRTTSTCVKVVHDVETWWRWAHDHDERWEGQVPRPRPMTMPEFAVARVVAPTFEEMDACLAELAGWQWRAGVVMRFTGLRVAQVMGLDWSDIDLERATLTLRGELGKTRAEQRGRTVPISPALVDLLAGWGVRAGVLVPSGRLTREFRPRDMSRAWTRAGVREAAWKGRPDHAFRKGFTTGLKRLGADVEAVEYLVGHALPGERGTYLDPDALALREAVALLPPLGGDLVRFGPRVAESGAGG